MTTDRKIEIEIIKKMKDFDCGLIRDGFVNRRFLCNLEYHPLKIDELDIAHCFILNDLRQTIYLEFKCFLPILFHPSIYAVDATNVKDLQEGDLLYKDKLGSSENFMNYYGPCFAKVRFVANL